MLLAIDAGNSNIVFGVYEGREQLFCARVKTDSRKTEYEYAVLLNELFGLWGVRPDAVEGAAISSVVPALTDALKQAVCILCHRSALVVGPGIKTGINLRIDDPGEAGADLVCTAVGVVEKYPLPAIIIDLGTATKILAIDQKRNFLGCAIAPGVMVSLGALSSAAAQLPHIGLNTGLKVIGTNTIDSMMAGSVLGTAAMIDGMVERYREKLGQNATIVACGGLIDAIVPHCRISILSDPSLLLDGLIAIYYKNTIA
ncbi:MAG: type III pantothenate kinase [Oscillospiraceae bacterium]